MRVPADPWLSAHDRRSDTVRHLAWLHVYDRRRAGAKGRWGVSGEGYGCAPHTNEFGTREIPFERGSLASGENTGRTWRACRFGPSHTDGHVLSRVRRVSVEPSGSGSGRYFGAESPPFNRGRRLFDSSLRPESDERKWRAREIWPPLWTENDFCRSGAASPWKTVDFKHETQKTCLK